MRDKDYNAMYEENNRIDENRKRTDSKICSTVQHDRRASQQMDENYNNMKDSG
jgi:hypothetical protein